MNKAKSIFVTALVALLTAAVILCLYLLKIRVWLIAVGLLGLYGFACGAVGFCRWLGNERKLLIPPAALDVPDVVEGEDVIAVSYDQIKAECERMRTKEDGRWKD